MMLRTQNAVVLCSLIILHQVAVTRAQSPPTPTASAPAPVSTERPAAPASPHPGWEKLKQLAGEWIAAVDAAAEKDTSADAVLPLCIYRVTSAGSVVQETLFPGTPHEMVTMYHLDGPDLVLTHYCALGNQPRMRAEPPGAPNKLVFKFAGGTNIDPAKDGHMHDLTLTFIDADHVRAEWASYAKGRQSGVKTFEMKRKK
jgi:hypothetical protein